MFFCAQSHSIHPTFLLINPKTFVTPVSLFLFKIRHFNWFLDFIITNNNSYELFFPHVMMMEIVRFYNLRKQAIKMIIINNIFRCYVNFVKLIIVAFDVRNYSPLYYLCALRNIPFSFSTNNKNWYKLRKWMSRIFHSIRYRTTHKICIWWILRWLNNSIFTTPLCNINCTRSSRLQSRCLFEY